LICLEPVWTTGQQTNDAIAQKQEKALQGVFWLAKVLKTTLTGRKDEERSIFMTVTRMDGLLGTTGEGSWSAISGGLFGLTKTLSLEWEDVFCRAVDLDTELNAQEGAACILAELEDPDHTLVEVGYGPQQRVTLALAEPAPRRNA
jgi:hypothetical protein